MSDVAEAPRLLPLTGGFNLRDMGGYATADCRRVKRGMLFRSGTMTLLTPEDEAHVIALGIKTVCDLRRPGERDREPTRWCEPAGVHYFARDYGETSGVLSELLKHGAGGAEAMRQAMIDLYRDIPQDHAPSYRHMFERLLAGEAPLLFNCSAGKDRTGFGAMLILHALGVPKETILEDYLETNAHADFQRLFDGGAASVKRMAEFDRAMLAPVMAADADYLALAYAHLDARHGGVDAYLADVIGVGPAERERLISLLLE